MAEAAGGLPWAKGRHAAAIALQHAQYLVAKAGDVLFQLLQRTQGKDYSLHTLIPSISYSPHTLTKYNRFALLCLGLI